MTLGSKIKYFMIKGAAMAIILPSLATATSSLSPSQVHLLLDDYFKGMTKWRVDTGYNHNKYDFNNNIDNGDFYTYDGSNKSYHVTLSKYLSQSVVLGVTYKNTQGHVISQSKLSQNNAGDFIDTQKHNDSDSNTLGVRIKKLFNSGLHISGSLNVGSTNYTLDQNIRNTVLNTNSVGNSRYSSVNWAAGLDTGMVYHFNPGFTLMGMIATTYSRTRQNGFGTALQVRALNGQTSSSTLNQPGSTVSNWSAVENAELSYKATSTIHPYVGAGLYQVLARSGLTSTSLLGEATPDFQAGYHGYNMLVGTSISLTQNVALNVMFNRFLISRGFRSNTFSGSVLVNF